MMPTFPDPPYHSVRGVFPVRLETGFPSGAFWVISGFSLLPVFRRRHPVCVRLCAPRGHVDYPVLRRVEDWECTAVVGGPRGPRSGPGCSVRFVIT